MSADVDIASYEPGVSDVSDDAYDVVHVCVIADDVTNDVRRHCGWYRSSRRYSFEQRAVTTIE